MISAVSEDDDAGSSPPVTVTVAVPLFVVSTVEVALTVKVAALSSTATERTPAGLMAVPAPPPLTDQVTVWAGLFVPLTVALKVAVPPFATFAVSGLTVTPCSTLTKHLPENRSSVLETTITLSVYVLRPIEAVFRVYEAPVSPDIATPSRYH
jgi:hypothetical protein